MKTPMNQLGLPVNVGDVVALTTTSGKSSRTRIAKVVKLVQGSEIRSWDHKTRTTIRTGEYYCRVFVRLFSKSRKWDSTSGTYLPETYRSYVKEVFGIRDSLPISASSIPYKIQEVLNGK